MGDNIMLNSLMLELKRNNDIHLTIFNPHKSFTGLFEKMPVIDEIINFSIPKKKLSLKSRYKAAKILQKHNFDEIIFAPNTLKAGLIGCLARIKKRTGWHGEGRLFMLNNRLKNVTRYTTMVERYVALAYNHNNDKVQYNTCQLPVLKGDKANSIKLFRKFRITSNNKQNIMLCPGAAYGETKRWPSKKFSDLINILSQQKYNIHILGGPQEQDIAAEIIKLCGSDTVMNWVGKLSIAESIDVMSRMDCVVANDSGLMHMAAALEVPIVAIYGATKPSFAPPLSKKAKSVWDEISCRPCKSRVCPLSHLDCLNNIAAGVIKTNIEKLLNGDNIL